jgi:hypothetical protein
LFVLGSGDGQRRSVSGSTTEEVAGLGDEFRVTLDVVIDVPELYGSA